MSKELTPLQALESIIESFFDKDSEDIKTVRKALKALEIIKTKPIVALVDYKYTYEEWLDLVEEKDKDLFENKEEYDLLKEVLK